MKFIALDFISVITITHSDWKRTFAKLKFFNDGEGLFLIEMKALLHCTLTSTAGSKKLTSQTEHILALCRCQ